MSGREPPPTLEQAQVLHQEARGAYASLVARVQGLRQVPAEEQQALAQAAAAVAVAQGAEVAARLRDTWEPWSPPFAAHVEGRWTRRVFDTETGMPEEQKVQVQCKVCGGSWEGRCSSGRVRDHIGRFAQQHLHRDPFAGAKR